MKTIDITGYNLNMRDASGNWATPREKHIKRQDYQNGDSEIRQGQLWSIRGRRAIVEYPRIDKRNQHSN